MSTHQPPTPSYDEVVAGWADHLRSGGTTTWSAWLDDDPTAAPPARPAPDAVHLELLRRLNAAAGGRDTPGLADLVLSTASPGRGLVDVPLPWPPSPPRYGSPAIDPVRLPEEELIRLATGLLVRLLPGLPRPEVPAEPSSVPVPWRRRFLLHGSPGTAAAVRRGLLAQGLVESDWRPTHVVIARSVEVMMAEHWAANARAGGILKWSTLWRRAQATGLLPGEIDVGTLAARLEGRRREPVHVVVAREAQQAAEATARLLRARPLEVGGSGDLTETDLLRRVNRLTALTGGSAQVRDLALRLAAVLDQMAAQGGSPRAPVVPRASFAWATERATTLGRELRSAGYAVHGDVAVLAPAHHEHSGAVDRTRTLELAIAVCLRIWRLQGGTR
jgi:hypothetical protein